MTNFIFGIIFAILITPLIDGLTSVGLTIIEAIKSYLGVIIYNNNQKVSASTKSRTIGFVTEEDEEE